MAEREKCCAFTGHRPQRLPQNGDENSNQIIRCKHFLFMEIHKAAEEGYREFLSGMAMGTDLWCAEIVLALKRVFPEISLHAVLPWKTQAASWPRPWQRRHQDALARADRVTVLRESYAPYCFALRNRYLTEHADRLIALCDGVSGGSGMTVSLAKKAGCQIILCDPFLLAKEEISADSLHEKNECVL